MSQHLSDISSAEVAGKRVFVRADLNVPISKGVITDATRLERFAPTVVNLASRGAKVIICSHLGRPKGAPNADDSMAPIAAALESFIHQSVTFVDQVSGDTAEKASKELKNGEVLVLENVRFHPGETTNDDNFAAELARLGDLYVNDAFSAAHRAHASTAGIARHLPAFAGPSLLAEVNALSQALEVPKRPVTAVVGGAKISTKIDILLYLINKVDCLVIGGGMANTFLAAKGIDMGKSLCEKEAFDKAEAIMKAAEEKTCRLILPSDFVVAEAFDAEAAHKVVAQDAVPTQSMALDLGPDTIATINEALESSQTCLWNGPLGAFELAPFAKATVDVAQKAADLTEQGKLITIAGGGDTVAALNLAGVTRRFTYVSTAGGAFLEWLEGKALPGIAALMS